MEIVQTLAEHAGDICQIATCAALLIKPVREWIMGTEALRGAKVSAAVGDRADLLPAQRHQAAAGI